MKKIYVGPAILVLTMSAGLLAQNSVPSTAPSAAPPATALPSANPGQPAGEPRIAPGSVIPVELTKTVDAKKAKTGDEVVAKVTMDMKGGTGEIILPKDTKVVGHITEAQPRSKEQKESQLAIAFDQAVVKNEQVPLPMSIQAVIGPQPNDDAAANSAPSSSPSPSSTGTTATSPMSGRTGNAGPPPTAGTMGNPGAPPEASKRPPINAQTQGVIGISNLNLSPNSNAKQGTMMSSEKNNVKLESGTMLLLRVNQ